MLRALTKKVVTSGKRLHASFVSVLKATASKLPASWSVSWKFICRFAFLIAERFLRSSAFREICLAACWPTSLQSCFDITKVDNLVRRSWNECDHFQAIIRQFTVSFNSLICLRTRNIFSYETTWQTMWHPQRRCNARMPSSSWGNYKFKCHGISTMKLVSVYLVLMGATTQGCSTLEVMRDDQCIFGKHLLIQMACS